jgi:hypothetical protein
MVKLIPGTIWFVPNSELGISNTRTKEHPVLVMMRTPIVQIAGGSHDPSRFGKDAVLVRFNSNDMDTSAGGKGLDFGLTYFELSALIPLTRKRAGLKWRFLGALRAQAFTRAVYLMEDKGIGF